MDDDVIVARQGLISLLAGCFFGAGWWVFIDGFGYGSFLGDSVSKEVSGYAWLPLFAVTISYVMINGMKWSELRDDSVSDPRTAVKARIFLLFALLIVMAGLAGSVFIMVDKFLRVENIATTWPGISCFVGTLLITLAMFLQRFGTLPSSDSAY